MDDTREIEVTIKLRWSGNILFIGCYAAGNVSPPLPADRRMRGIDFHPDDWIAAPVHGYGSYHATEAEARAALEVAVIKALEWTT